MPSFTLEGLNKQTIFLAIALMFIIVMMILPVPAWVLDVGLTVSFAFAVLIFTVTLFVQKPLDFSSFPSILLASLLLRLSLNVSSTKLIIGNGHKGSDAAGGVIEGFAMFVMGNNIFIGLIVFTVLVIVNFLVITKGAGRMAEVGARFALDAMPGKQMAIDADLSAGAITHKEASERRAREQEETAFLGSLDGVSKFVKGDAIAGLLITLLNLVAGISVGLVMHQISFGEAIQNYSILTVGDGLVSQIPAVIISIAAALLLSKGRSEQAMDDALVTQLTRHPGALATVAVMLLIFAAMPGLPFAPFMIGATGLGYLGYQGFQKEKKKYAAEKRAQAEQLDTKPQETLGDLLDLDDIHLEFAKDLVPVTMSEEANFDDRIEKIRKFIAEEFGFIVPPIRITDSALLEEGAYRIKVHGVEVANSVLRPNCVLALLGEGEFPHIAGEAVQEPVYKAPARWVRISLKEELLMTGSPVIEPVEVVATHILETIQANFSRLMTRRVTREIIDAFVRTSDIDRSQANQKVVDEFIPEKVPWDILQGVLRGLLDERISIRNLPVIFESIAEIKGTLNSVDHIAEYVRQRLSFQFVNKLQDETGRVPIIQLSPSWEELFTEHENVSEGGNVDIALPPQEFNRLAVAIQEKLNSSAEQGHFAAITTSTRRRRFVRTVLSSKGIKNPVISFEELANNGRPAIMGVA